MRFRSEAGLTTAELSMLAGVMLLLIFVPVQLAIREHSAQVAQGAAREGLSTAQTYGANDQDGIASAEAFLAAAGHLTNPVVTVTRTTETLTIEVTGQAPGIVPGFNLTVVARASGPVERFIPGSER